MSGDTSSSNTVGNPKTTDSPLRAVLESFEAGATSIAGIARETGLSLDLVRAVVDQLIRMGKLRATAMSYGCPIDSSDCGGCASASAMGAACDSGPNHSRGPVLIELSNPSLHQRPSQDDH